MGTRPIARDLRLSPLLPGSQWAESLIELFGPVHSITELKDLVMY